MEVYTYYAAVNNLRHPGALLEIWERSWRNRGWTPIILGINDALRHPGFEMYHAAVLKLPSINPPGYDLSCYHRWLAMAGRGGLLTDYDCINYSYTPEACLEDFPKLDKLCLFEPSRVPCAAIGRRRDYYDLACYFTTFRCAPGQRHTSDMYIISAAAEHPIVPRCIHYQDHGWETSPLVHYSTSSLRDKSIIPSLRPL